MKIKYGITRTIGLAFCLGAVLAAGASSGESSIQKVDDLHGKRIGVLEGSMNGEAIRQKIPDFTLLYYMTTPDLLSSLKSGGLDAVIAEIPALILWTAKDPELRMLREPLQENTYALITGKNSKELCDRVNAILREFRSDGTLERLHNKWMTGPAEGKKLPEIPDAGGETQVLRYGVADIGEPFVYQDADGNLIGYDVELGLLIANKLGAKLELKEWLFAHLLQAAAAGNIDLGASSISVTPERQEEVLFTLPYYRGGAGILVRK